MALESKVWKWYGRHKNAINTILEMSSDLLPGGRMLLGTLRLVHNWVVDKKEDRQEHQIQQVEKWLSEIKPIMSDAVEEIENLEKFKSATTEVQARKAVEESEVRIEVQEILPQLSQSISRSISQLSETQILNNRYRLEKKIGRGGQGEVYLARHMVADIPVAVKLLPMELTDDTMAIVRLRREYNRLLERLTHENIVQYRDLDQDTKSGRFFIVMDYIPGNNLRKMLLEEGEAGMPLPQILEILYPVATALDFAHENKIVHCDLKPENIILREDRKVFLTDFGLSHEIHSSLSRRPTTGFNIAGTLPYMSPEQYLGRSVNGYSDVWALGVILYEMIAGHHPFQGTNFDHYMKLICEIQPSPIPTLTDKQREILAQMMHKESQKRPLSTKDALQSFLPSEAYAFSKKDSAAWKEAQTSLSAVDKNIPTEKKPEKAPSIPVSENLSSLPNNQEPLWETFTKSMPQSSVTYSSESVSAKPMPVSAAFAVAIPGFTFLRKQKYQCGAHVFSIEEYRHEGTEMEFALLPAGVFLMGSPKSDTQRNEDEARHKVKLSSFLMARYPCTQKQWQKVMGKNPSQWQNEAYPVEKVSFVDCQAFCSAAGLSLPTEAQWEYACRAGSEESYCFGDDLSLLSEYGWYVDNSQNHSHKVGEKKPNAFGIYDMHGNIWEWCLDACEWDLKKGVMTPSYPSETLDPVSTSGRHRIFRGGSWDSAPNYCRCAFRGSFLPHKQDYSLGVRFACALEV